MPHRSFHHIIQQGQWYSDPQWMAIIVALALGVAGIFQDWIRSLFRKPKLSVSIKLAPPDCHKTAFYGTQVDRKIADTYYFRFRVENRGNSHAEDVEAMVTEVHQKTSSGEYERIENFLPLNLVWAHSRQATMPKIQPKLFKHLDFGHILQRNDDHLRRFGITQSPEVFFELDVAVMPNTGSHILLPGEYRVKVVFAGNNLKPQEKIYQLSMRDAWSDNETEMFAKNVSIAE